MHVSKEGDFAQWLALTQIAWAQTPPFLLPTR